MVTTQFSSTDKFEIINFLKGLNHIDSSLLMVFSDKTFLADSEISTELKNLGEKIPMIGCSTAGGIIGDNLLDAAFIINIIKFEHSFAKKASVSFSETSESFAVGKELAEALLAPDLAYVFILSDGIFINGSRLVEGINSVVKNKVIVSGGLAGDNADFAYTLVNDSNNSFNKNVVSAIGFYGNRIQINCGAFGGWEDFGIERTVTKSKENIVYEIDHKPALELYKTYLGAKAKDLPASALLFPLSIQQKKGADQLVRTILNINEEENSLVFAGNIPEGTKVKLMKPGSGSLISQLEIDDKLSEFNFTEDATGLVIMVSCIGRKLVMKQQTQEEIESVTEKLNPNFKFTGFYSYGEIFTTKKEKNEHSNSDDAFLTEFMQCEYGDCVLNNQTMTVTCIREL